MEQGFLFQGQHYTWQQKARGTPALDRPIQQFVHFLENHDQVANSAAGRRLSELWSPGQLRALTALLLVGPPTPLLFQGQEFGATSPFLYFAHHSPELARQVRDGRQEFLNQFGRFRASRGSVASTRPIGGATFDSCKLTYDDSERSQQFLRLHCDLLALRRDDRRWRCRGRSVWTAPRSTINRCSCDFSELTMTTGCWSSILEATSTSRSRASRCGAAGTKALAGPVVERRAGVRRQRHAGVDGESLAVPGHAALVIGPLARLRPRWPRSDLTTSRCHDDQARSRTARDRRQRHAACPSAASRGREKAIGHDGDVPAHEWLVTNGLGGYASGTVVGAITRRFHGLLIAACQHRLAA